MAFPVKPLSRILYDRLRDRFDPRVKDSVARRLAQRVALAVIGNRLAAWEPLHERAILLATQAEQLPVEQLHAIFEEICGVLLVGHVVPLQQVKRDIMEARDWYLGMCICRQARRVNDLYLPDSEQVYLLGSEDDCRPWLQRLVRTWERVQGSDHVTSPEATALLRRFATLGRVGDEGYSTGAFFEQSWPHYELLLDHPRYVSHWRQTMRNNRRTWRMHPEVLAAWVDLAYFARGAVFTSMAVVDERYTICTCPGPENDGGCLLFNWTFHSDNPHVLRCHAEGQRQDERGEPLPCARFEGRADKPCFGCGCDHDAPGGELPARLPDPRPGYDD